VLGISVLFSAWDALERVNSRWKTSCNHLSKLEWLKGKSKFDKRESSRLVSWRTEYQTQRDWVRQCRDVIIPRAGESAPY
jgi:hypothetical protein